jgi:hypothetical protein
VGVSEPIQADVVRGALLTILDEIMSRVGGYVLDDGTSMFETLTGISALEASRPVSSQSANLASQVNHVRFYVDAVLDQTENADWDGSWQVGAVTDAEWHALIERLRVSTERTRQFIQTFEQWDARYLGGAIALIAHCAYHLGEIRQGIGVLRTRA